MACPSLLRVAAMLLLFSSAYSHSLSQPELSQDNSIAVASENAVESVSRGLLGDKPKHKHGKKDKKDSKKDKKVSKSKKSKKSSKKSKCNKKCKKVKKCKSKCKRPCKKKCYKKKSTKSKKSKSKCYKKCTKKCRKKCTKKSGKSSKGKKPAGSSPDVVPIYSSPPAYGGY